MIDILLYLLYYQQAKQASQPQTKDEIKMGIFCHAKLDYFYGAIYSTKFTTNSGTARRGRGAHPLPPPFRRNSQVFGHFLEGKRPGKCQTWPQYNEDLWTCLGAIRAA